uniref:Uncharacterized protein n=1 Tax=Lygus hesperus TaxID=30085 RepID=A0A0A9YVG9_LYGHE
MRKTDTPSEDSDEYSGSESSDTISLHGTAIQSKKQSSYDTNKYPTYTSHVLSMAKNTSDIQPSTPDVGKKVPVSDNATAQQLTQQSTSYIGVNQQNQGQSVLTTYASSISGRRPASIHSVNSHISAHVPITSNVSMWSDLAQHKVLQDSSTIDKLKEYTNSNVTPKPLPATTAVINPETTLNRKLSLQQAAATISTRPSQLPPLPTNVVAAHNDIEQNSYHDTTYLYSLPYRNASVPVEELQKVKLDPNNHPSIVTPTNSHPMSKGMVVVNSISNSQSLSTSAQAVTPACVHGSTDAASNKHQCTFNSDTTVCQYSQQLQSS